MAYSTESAVTVGPFLAAMAALEKEKLKLHANIVKTLAECVPGWKGFQQTDDINVDHLGGAMTNLIFAVSKPDGENPGVLLRIYGEGTESFFKRKEETRLFQLLSEKDIGVELLGQFSNGRAEKLIQGATFTWKRMRSPEWIPLVAKKMRQFHEIDIDIDHTPRYLSEPQRLLEIAKKKCVGEKFKNIVDFAQLDKDLKELEDTLAKVHSPIVLSHNDLQYGNIMESDGNVVLIDFEYTSYNPRGYDIGNHFCEWAYNYHKSINPHLGDFSKYPSVEQQRAFCRAYLENDDNTPVTDEEVDALRLEANTYSLASHLFWGLWGYIQASQSEIDFDFLAYGKCRYDAFKSRVTLKN